MAGDSSSHLADSGIEAGTEHGVTLIVILVFLSISFYNVVELTLIIFTTFKRFSGLYFWSFLISTWGIAVWSMGFLLKYTGVVGHIPNHYLLYMTFIEVGFVCMVTGQGVVLYSRLHIIVRRRRTLQLALGMVIFDAIICHIPIIVVAFGTNSPNPGPFIVPYSVYEKVQVTIFFIQELILSGLYIGETAKMMRVERHTGIGKGGSRKLMKHLVLVNVIIIILDITILGLEFAGYYQLQTAYKGMVYSVKLKMEFSILNRLVEMVGGPSSSSLTNSRGQPNTALRSRAVPHTDKAGIAMDTFEGDEIKKVDGERRIRLPDDDLEEGNMGYSAYVHRGGDLGAGRGSVRVDGRPIITRTTEVVIHHRDDVDDSDSMEADEHGNRVKGLRSTSSSEIQFAKA
ncbi:hypothetical protein B0H63DRAFT_428568 [Podospora didyma]|uniref:DUF7703 domain-containing protein n=1 Tax=Podospora didyma TaxID=330526 RepID=A0AAE0U482_9PEZI|nr:hypothetical protein B0H63DRAFT_428568 [Podospora didyma]